MFMNLTIADSDPELAQEAFGWDPSFVTLGSGIERAWRCKEGHIFIASPNARTSRRKTIQCPDCSGKMLVQGKNDLLTTHSEVAKEAFGWDPSTLTSGVGISKEWKCQLGHIYAAKVAHRSSGTGCPYCANRRVLPGFNDLNTTHPQLAEQAYGWDPTTVTYGSGRQLRWRCSQGHIFIATPNKRTNRITKVHCPYSNRGENHL